MEAEEVRARARALWELGEYPRLAQLFLPVAEALVRTVGVRPGERVLDVATGTGNVALAAARCGAAVTASDLTARMLELARQRARSAGADLEWVEADLEDLPFPDGSFDVATSSFGVIFAPHPARAVDELARILRPGGRLALASWSNDGYVGAMSAIVREIVSPPPGTPDTMDWAPQTCCGCGCPAPSPT